jgi:hypothetical protein
VKKSSRHRGGKGLEGLLAGEAHGFDDGDAVLARGAGGTTGRLGGGRGGKGLREVWGVRGGSKKKRGRERICSIGRKKGRGEERM